MRVSNRRFCVVGLAVISIVLCGKQDGLAASGGHGSTSTSSPATGDGAAATAPAGKEVSASGPGAQERLPEAPASWIQVPVGNSGGTLASHLPGIICTFAVRGDGTVITASSWDEGLHVSALVRDGNLVGFCTGLGGWGAGGGGYVAINSKRIFNSINLGGAATMQNRSDMVSPPVGTTWIGFEYFGIDGNAPGGKLYANMVEATSVPQGTKPVPAVTGMAATESRVFVAVGSQNRVYVHDAATNEQLTVWTIENPGVMQTDAQGFVWIIQGAAVVQYDANGEPTGRSIAGAGQPYALGTAPGGDLLVTDGNALTVRRYGSLQTTPTVTKTWTTNTTTYTGAPGPFMWRGLLKGASCDAAGNMYVICMDGAHAVYECYSPDDRLLWQALALVADEAAAPILAANGTSVDVYTTFDLFNVDLTANPPRWVWKGHTHDSIAFPDPAVAGHACPQAQLVKGRRLVAMGSHYGGPPVTIYAHMAAGSTTLMPLTTLNGASGLGTEWSWWFAPNGDLWEVASAGGIRRHTFTGFDAKGVPQYTAGPMVKPPNPTGDSWGADAFCRARYDAATDTMMVAGHTTKKPRGPTWGEFRVIVAYSKWSKTPVQKWRIDLPYGTEDWGKIVTKDAGWFRGMELVGDRLFLQTMQTETVFVFDAKTGEYLTRYFPNVSSWNDVNEGLRVIRLPNGGYFGTILSIMAESAVCLYVGLDANSK